MADPQENLQESHETESRSTEETKKNEDEDVIERQRSFRSNPSSHQSRVSRAYPIRSRNKDCKHYLSKGWCGYGSKCLFNHPKELNKRNSRICRFFLKGYCKNGSTCLYRHHMAGAETESMRLVRSIDQIHGTESESRPEKRARTIPDSQERGSREKFEDLEQDAQVHGTESGSRPEKRARTIPDPQDQRQENIERQEREAQENLQEVPENQNLTEEQRQKDIERLRNEARSSLDQMKPNVEFNDLSAIRTSLGELKVKRKEGDGF